MTKKTVKKKAAKKDRFMKMETRHGGARVVKDGKVVSDSNDEKAEQLKTEKDKTDVD